jgi:integrase/recombinase XerD
MTFFDTFYRTPSVRRIHNCAPFRQRRTNFLLDMRQRGCQENTLRQFSSHLLQVNRMLGFRKSMRIVTEAELSSVAKRWESYIGPLRRRRPGKLTYALFMRVARRWLRFNNCLAQPRKAYLDDNRLEDFGTRLRERFGLASATVEHRQRHASFFLAWLAERRVHLRHINISHLERYLESKRDGGWVLGTQVAAAYSLRMFLRHAEERGWVKAGIHHAVPTFRIPKHEFVSKGPSWDGVQRIVSSLLGRTPLELRDRALVLLVAFYGFRCGEIRRLQLADVDLERGILTIARSKNTQAQRFPLSGKVVFALRKYICEARPTSTSQALFITHLPPYKTISHGTVYDTCSRMFRTNGVESPRKGSHAFRHACAMRLMRTGSSLSEIAAFLGHKGLQTVGDYVRYDTKSLRAITTLSLEGLM